MGSAFFFFSLFGTGAGMLSGWLLSQYPGTRTFSFLYFAAGTIMALSMLFFWMVRDPAEKDHIDRSQLSAKDIIQRFRESLANPNFRKFLIGRLFASIGFCMVPFIALHYQSSQGGGLTSGTIVSCGAALTFGMALANLFLGRLGDKKGHRIGIVVGTVFQVITLFILLSGAGKWVCLATYFCAGVSMAGAFVSHTNMLFETCPHDHRLAHITIGNMVLALPMIAAPLAAGFAAELWGNLTLFKICLCFSAAAAVWMTLMVKEPRHLDL
jgi:MFS family permease